MVERGEEGGIFVLGGNEGDSIGGGRELLNN
jgi:hypothetical protein